jgi:hypothetical protein
MDSFYKKLLFLVWISRKEKNLRRKNYIVIKTYAEFVADEALGPDHVQVVGTGLVLTELLLAQLELGELGKVGLQAVSA